MGPWFLLARVSSTRSGLGVGGVCGIGERMDRAGSAERRPEEFRAKRMRRPRERGSSLGGRRKDPGSPTGHTTPPNPPEGLFPRSRFTQPCPLLRLHRSAGGTTPSPSPLRPQKADQTPPCIQSATPTGLLMAAKHCTANREGKVLLSCWISPELRLELERVWEAKGLKSHGRSQKGLEDMITAYLAAQREAS